jgi:DnaJ-class molecular chaperone
MRRLKLAGEEPTEEEIKAAFRREAAKAHPDRVPPEGRKAAHDKFVGLGEAKDWLLANKKRKAA